MKLYQFSKRKPCYYCGWPPPSSVEHVPPKMLFKSSNFSAITVPSCKVHNKEKDGQDHGFVTSLRLGVKFLIENGMMQSEISRTTMDSVLHVSPSDQLQVGEIRRYLVQDVGEVDSLLPYINSSSDLFQWIRLISAGLMWSRFGEVSTGFEWDNSLVLCPNLVQVEGPINPQEALDYALSAKNILELSQNADWQHGWYRDPYGYPEDIYNYSYMTFENEGSYYLTFQHNFYLSFTFFLLVEVPESFKELIISM